MAAATEAGLRSRVGGGDDTRRASETAQSLLQPSAEEDFANVAPPNPPDKGFGWFVVLGSFLCNALVDGCCFSYGVLQPHVASSFPDASPSLLSLGGSILTGTYLFTGPISSALANMFGCRAVVMAGALLSMIAFFGASFVPSVQAFIGVFGFIGGLGFGLIYLPAVVTVGFWFEKRRAFATGIAVCGSGIGTAVFALLTDYLIDLYSWRGTLIVLAGLVFNCAVAGSFFMPLERYYLILTLREKRRRAKGVPMVRGHIIEKMIENKRRERNISQGSLNGWIITTANKVEPPPPDFDDRPMLNTDAIQRIAENVLRRKISHGRRFTTSAAAAAAAVAAGRSGTVSGGGGTETSVAPAPVVTSHYQQNQHRPVLPQLVRDYSQSQTSLPQAYCPSQPQSNAQSMQSLNQQQQPQQPLPPQPDAVIHDEMLEAISKSLLREMHRPINRKDAFLISGSLHQLAEYAQSRTSVAGTREYYRSVTSIPPEVGQPGAPVKSAIRQMLDFSILKSITFCLLLFTAVLTMMGFLQFYQFIKMYAVKQGVPDKQATLLIFLIGVTNTAGRIISGWASDRPWADCLWINNLALIGSGIATASIPFCRTFLPMVICACTYGFFISAWVSLRTILVVELMGLERLTNAFGLLLLFQGLGIIVGPPLSSAIDQLDPSGNFSLSFYTAGALLALSGVMGVPLRAISRWEAGRASASRNSGGGGQRPVKGSPGATQRSILISASQPLTEDLQSQQQQFGDSTPEHAAQQHLQRAAAEIPQQQRLVTRSFRGDSSPTADMTESRL